MFAHSSRLYVVSIKLLSSWKPRSIKKGNGEPIKTFSGVLYALPTSLAAYRNWTLAAPSVFTDTIDRFLKDLWTTAEVTREMEIGFCFNWRRLCSFARKHVKNQSLSTHRLAVLVARVSGLYLDVSTIFKFHTLTELWLILSSAYLLSLSFANSMTEE